MALSTQPYKGVRDFYPEDMRVQQYIFDTWSSVCRLYGYEAYTASLLESVEIYEAKSGQEIVNEEMYTLVDKGDRRVALRHEMTPTVSRMVAGKRQELGYPLRWFSIPNLFRYDRPQRGRLREHWQLNVDIFGVPGVSAEHELISVSDKIMKAFGAKSSMYQIRINSRKFLDFVLKDYLKLDDVEAHTIAKLIDKMHKIDRAEFVALVEASINPGQRADTVEKLVAILDTQNPALLPDEVKAHESLNAVGDLMVLLEKSGVTNARFDSTLMRGFDYYTDIVFEVFDLHPDNNRSMFGGGRYDGLVGMFGVDSVPTVGFGQGDVTMQLFLEAHSLLPELKSETELYVALMGDLYERSFKTVEYLRTEGVNVAIDTSGRKIGDQLKTATKKGIVYAVVIGENELESQRFRLKNLLTGAEEELSIERLIAAVKSVK